MIDKKIKLTAKRNKSKKKQIMYKKGGREKIMDTLLLVKCKNKRSFINNTPYKQDTLRVKRNNCLLKK